MRKALVIGVNDYPSSPLKACVNDALAMSNVLETHGDGSPNFEIKLMTSAGGPIRKSNVKAAIESLFSGDSDIALLYFSGHGFLNSTGGYIVTQDAQQYDEGVSMTEILAYANASQAKDKIIILDCCHSGAIGKSPVIGNSVVQLTDGLSILTASLEAESALEIGSESVFTALVVDALQGGAADLRGHVTPGSIYAYVDQALGAWDQRPIFRTNIKRFTSLRDIPPRVAPAILRKLTEYFPLPQDEHRLDPSYEFTNTPDRGSEFVDPIADPLKVAVMKDLQKFVSVGLVVPIGEEHMYFAAMNFKSCRLTALGFQYWRLVKKNRL